MEYSAKVMMVPQKGTRLAEFLNRLSSAAACGNHDEAFDLIRRTLTEVEDEMTGIPNDPNAWMTDGRMYPPQQDSERRSPRPGIRRFRSRKHYLDIGCNGAFRIITVEAGATLIDKVATDGKKVSDL